jgi:hypothetical protein
MIFSAVAAAVLEMNMADSRRAATFVVVNSFYVAYLIPVVIGVWNAAGRYTGRTLWKWLARILMVIGAGSLPWHVAAVYEQIEATGLIESHTKEFIGFAVGPPLLIFQLNVIVGELVRAVRTRQYLTVSMLMTAVSISVTAWVVWIIVEKMHGL